MRRLNFSLVLGSIFTLGALGCASPASPSDTSGNGGSGQTSGNGGSGQTSGNGGSGQTSGSGGAKSTGGTGGSKNTGGTGGSGTATTCTPDATQLVNASGYNCDQSTSIAIEGSIYPYGDGASCPYGPTSPPANICTASAGCCLSGTTVVDSTYAKWGCGIGLELDDDGTTKNVYTGPVSCFMITLTGSSGGNVVRIGFTQSASPPSGAVAPYTEIPAFTSGWSGTVCFTDATCPGWATAAECSVTGAGTPVDMQIQISAGSTAATVGAYNVCLTSVVPMTSSTTGTTGTASCASPSGSGTLSGQYDTAHVGCPKDYMVQNNDWGVSSASQTITYGPGTKFKVTAQGGTGQNGAPASYPDIFTGANSGHSTSNSGLPLAVSSISATGIQTSWTYDDSTVASGSSYNAAYDVWFSTSSGGDPSAASPSGGYLMVWFYKPSDNQPIGATITNGTVTIGGNQFNIWYGTNSSSGKPVVSYVAQSKIKSWTFSLGAFIQDAVSRNCSGSTKCLQSSWYLTNVFSGFEIWKGGVGLQTTDFGVTVP